MRPLLARVGVERVGGCRAHPQTEAGAGVLKLAIRCGSIILAVLVVVAVVLGFVVHWRVDDPVCGLRW